MARNLFDRSYAGLFLPLDHEQYAPPLYLVLTKALADTFGYRELVLRLPAFLGGWLGVYGVWKVSKKTLDEYWTLLPPALLFGNGIVLRYVTEVKPYALDMGIAALLLTLHLRARPLFPLLWLVVGMVCPWVSLPSVFVLAMVGLRGLQYNYRQWVGPIVGWLLSFVVLYVTVLRPSVGSDYLNDFHRDYFLPLVLDGEGLARLGRIGYRFLRLSFGVTWVALVWGALLLLVGLFIRPRLSWLLLPLLLVALVSSFQYYSLIDRLLLFVLPGVWLFAAASARALADRVDRKPSWAIVGLSLLMAGGGNVWSKFYSPERTSDGRELAMLAQVPDAYVHPSAVPVVDYYARIHPVTRYRATPVGTTLPDRKADSYTILFDVTTDPVTYRQASEAAERAAARGCNAEVRELFRARVVEVRCRARNSDP
ncbi:hypothetical protein [Neolewinella sp.]|uniref:hypothetical protein n=1 Tax=Neolewinella sp. TaxID=2993543 RepID=UPI003B52E7BB